MKRKAVFFDLDGTLAYKNMPPAPEDCQAIQQMREQGHFAFLCTGRVPYHIYDSILSMGFDGLVAGAGAYVRVGEKVVSETFLDDQTVSAVIQHYIENGQTCLLEGEENLYVVCPREEWRGIWPRVLSPKDFCSPDGAFYKKRIFKFTAYGQLQENTRALLEPALKIIDHGKHIEVLPASCSKASGIKQVLDICGIPRENSYAFGDSRNDLDMLQYVQVGIAMGNATEEVKRAAKYATATLEEHGVAYGIHQWVLT